eukprot:TRINITY_DN33652_c0_g1_i1.p1 TRINITY_DN33652_c0_g1~~TRINITY_DN33652_c0_g1_i1.p1  ORF type:complete len:297 (-),score=33.44 TRINITY_DN33652_c0_g1_i1:142-1032(-)
MSDFRDCGTVVRKIETGAAVVGGIGILALCIIGGYAESTRESILLDDLLHNDDDADARGSKLESASGTIRCVVICFFFTGVIDILVTLALLVFCLARTWSISPLVCGSGGSASAEGRTKGESDAPVSPLSRTLSMLTAVLSALFRFGYACVIISCLNGLAQVPGLLLDVQSDPHNKETESFIQHLWREFHLGFSGVALGLFGLHLALLALPMYFAGETKINGFSSFCFSTCVLPCSLVVAGFGYTADSIGIFLQDHTFGLTRNGCFVGEVLLMLWLLYFGFCRRVSIMEGAEGLLE